MWLRAQDFPLGLGHWASPLLPQGKERKPPAVSPEARDLERGTGGSCVMTGGSLCEPERTLTGMERQGPATPSVSFPPRKHGGSPSVQSAPALLVAMTKAPGF